MGKYDKFLPPDSGRPKSKYEKYLPAKDEGLLYKIPGVGPYLKSADDAVSSLIGRAPNPQELPQGAQDLARVGVNSVTLGGADYLADKTGLSDYTGGSEQTRQASERLGPGATAITDFAAGSVTPTGIPKRIAQGGKLVRTIGHGISGGVQNAVNEWTHGERDVGDLLKAGAVGSGLSAAANSIIDPVVTAFGKRKAAKALPETESLKAEGKQGYEDVKAMGGVYHRDDVRQLLAEFKNMNLAPGVDDRAIALRKWLNKSWQGQDISPDKLDQMRRIIRGKMKTANPNDRILGEDFLEGMDKFADKTPVTSSTGADIPGVNETLKAGRARYQQYYKAKEVDEAAPRKKGLLNVYGERSDVPAMERFEKIDERIKTKGGQGYTPAERQQMTKVATGSPIRDLGEGARKLSPLRSTPLAGVGAGVGLLTGGITWPLVGTAALEGISALGRSATQADINELQSLIKTGQGLTADPARMAAIKDKLARMMSAATRTGYDPAHTALGGAR